MPGPEFVLTEEHFRATPFIFQPSWWTITFITLFPAMFIYFPGRRKRRRRKLGLCVRCGYDLRGQSDASSGCPECGNPRRG